MAAMETKTAMSVDAMIPTVMDILRSLANVAAAFIAAIPWLKRSRKRSIKENISPLGECSFHE
jgi:hypothetical protein